MKWAFGWRLGPFEIWDALGVERFAGKLAEEGIELPAWVSKMIEKSDGTFYRLEQGRLGGLEPGRASLPSRAGRPRTDRAAAS